jgi:S-adenosylmethionine decarboxylase
MRGIEWIIDAHGCDPAALRDVDRLRELFHHLIDTLGLSPVAEPLWHRFPAPGGVTGLVMLAESHLACHTFPEFGSICLNLFCCRPRPDWDADPILVAYLGATAVTSRQIERVYADEPAPRAPMRPQTS